MQPTKTRMVEICEFAEKMGYTRLGLAFCLGLAKEAAVVEEILKKNGFEVFISPHYYYPTDHSWKFEGTLEKVMHEIKMFDRSGAFVMVANYGDGTAAKKNCRYPCRSIPVTRARRSLSVYYHSFLER